ncbi:MAG TPA: alcohol dehydrogenase catalytic domain-containing protein [Acidimicrobiia bacterium]|nr:alcohol dehydrogenase catalytic domain-containing protein [Acidimicrobiia bacterium]
MAAAVAHGPRDLRIEDVPVEAPAPGTVVVEVAYCGVCGSDLHAVLDGWGRPGSIHGHEWSGRVVAVGDGVDRWHEGDAVVGGPAPTCGRCGPCRAARPSLCIERPTPMAEASKGAYAAFKVAGADELWAVPDGLDLRTAALTEPLAVALHAVTRSGVAPGQRALVMGAGPIGALVITALRAVGVDDVTVCEPNPLRRDLALEIGAHEVVEPDEIDVPSMFEPLRLPDRPFDVALECSGKGVAMEAAITQVGKGGTFVLVGAGIDQPRFDPNRILLNELIVTGAYEYDATGFDDALALLAAGRIPVDDLVEADDVALPDLLDAMERLAAGDIAGKVMVTPTGGTR